MEASVIWQAGGSTWRSMTAAELAATLNAPKALAKMTLEQFFAGCAAAGGDPSELAKLWPFQQYIVWANEGLNAGDYQRVMALLATIPVELNEATQTAISAVVTAATLPAVAHFWPADAQDAPPVTVTAQDVSDALTAAGYVWSNGAWAVV
jgi:hypothetical protein